MTKELERLHGAVVSAIDHEVATVVAAQALVLSRQVTGELLLNVGGKRFETSQDVLCSVEGSFFHALAGGYAQVDACEDGSYFIDRSPKHFPLILDHLRGGQPRLQQLRRAELEALKAEADFYGLEALSAAVIAASKQRQPSVYSLQSLESSRSVSPGSPTSVVDLQPSPPDTLRFQPGPNYSLDEDERTVTKAGVNRYWDVTAVGPVLVPGGEGLAVRILETTTAFIMVGVAPEGIDRGATQNQTKCGWYLDAHSGTLHSEDGVRGRAYYRGGRVGVLCAVGVRVTEALELVFSVDGEDCGEAFLLPAERGPFRLAVLMRTSGDQVHLEQC